jgi:DNA methylase
LKFPSIRDARVALADARQCLAQRENASRRSFAYDGGNEFKHFGRRRRVKLVWNSNPGQAVYDPFLGSGTSLIAAETTGRVCLGMELEPRYVDVAVRRWQAFTGLDACLLGDGRSFAVVAAERLAGLQTTNLGSAPTQPVENDVKNDLAAT